MWCVQQARPAKTYSECVLGDTSPAWMLVSPRGLAQLNAEGVVELLDNEGNTVSFHTRLLRHFVEFLGRTYHCHPDAVDLATGACDLCSDSVPPVLAVMFFTTSVFDTLPH